MSNYRQIMLKYLGASFVLFLIFTFSAQAIEFGGLGGRPANPDSNIPNSDTWFIYSLGPGEQQQDAIIIQNTTSQDERIVIYPADSTPSSDGGFALKQKVEPMDGIGSWIRFYPFLPPTATPALIASLYDNQTEQLETIFGRCSLIQAPFGASYDSFTDHIELELKDPLTNAESIYLQELATWCQGLGEHELDLSTNELEVIPFVIAIPETADVGEHTGGLLIQRIKPDQASGTGIRLSTRVGVRIYETVPGEIVKDVSVTGFSVHFNKNKQVYIVSLKLLNNGNVSQVLDIDFIVKDLFFGKNNLVLNRSVQVLRDTELVTNFEWPKPKLGRYSFQAEISLPTDEGEKKVSTTELIIWLIPWPEVFIVLIVLVFLMAILFYHRSWRRKIAEAKGWQLYKAKKADTLSTLAQRTNTSWRRIALVNKISKPYTLNPGQQILLPSQPMAKLVAQKKVAIKPLLANQPTSAKTSQARPVKPKARLDAAGKALVPDRLTIQTPIQQSPPASSSGWLWLILVVVALMVAGILVLLQTEEVSYEDSKLLPAARLQPSLLETDKQAHPGLDSTTSSEALDLPVILLSDIRIVVLNGSGQPGLASKLARQLEGLDYVIDSTGNANNFNYEHVTIIYEIGDEAKFDLIEASLIELGYEIIDNEDSGTDEVLTIIIGR